jgi:hypothetical protein
MNDMKKAPRNIEALFVHGVEKFYAYSASADLMQVRGADCHELRQFLFKAPPRHDLKKMSPAFKPLCA